MMLDRKRNKRGAKLPEDHWIASEGRRRDAQQRARRHDALQKRWDRASAEEKCQRQLVCRHLYTFTRSSAHARNRKKMMMLDGKRKKKRSKIARGSLDCKRRPRTAQLRKCVQRG